MEQKIMRKNPLVQPVVKWVGGKRQLLQDLVPLLPKSFRSYCEPFFGGGAVLFNLQPKKAYINDINAELVNMYLVVRDNVEQLIDMLSQHKNESGYFYKVRDWDRDKSFYDNLDPVTKAARLIFLNKTCYNGLFRVNNAGEFNTPFGSYKNPNIVNAPVLRAVSVYLNTSEITISSMDYEDVLDSIKSSTFVYLDPPYDPVSDTASFTGYIKNGFNHEEQIRLKQNCDELDKRGVKFLLSNSATPFILDLYSNYKISSVLAKRAINSVGNRRGDVEEVIVQNYE
jgi:DNA adenine methylase